MTTTDEGTPASPKRGPGRDLPAAIAVGVSLFALVVVTLIWFHPGFIALLVLLTSAGAIELHHALRRVGMTSAIVPVVIGNIVIIGGTYAAAEFQKQTNVPWHVVLLGAIGGTVLVALIGRMFGGALHIRPLPVGNELACIGAAVLGNHIGNTGVDVDLMRQNAGVIHAVYMNNIRLAILPHISVE